MKPNNLEGGASPKSHPNRVKSDQTTKWPTRGIQTCFWVEFTNILKEKEQWCCDIGNRSRYYYISVPWIPVIIRSLISSHLSVQKMQECHHTLLYRSSNLWNIQCSLSHYHCLFEIVITNLLIEIYDKNKSMHNNVKHIELLNDEGLLYHKTIA